LCGAAQGLIDEEVDRHDAFGGSLWRPERSVSRLADLQNVADEDYTGRLRHLHDQIVRSRGNLVGNGRHSNAASAHLCWRGHTTDDLIHEKGRSQSYARKQ
jgi:hypothetical protein